MNGRNVAAIYFILYFLHHRHRPRFSVGCSIECRNIFVRHNLSAFSAAVNGFARISYSIIITQPPTLLKNAQTIHTAEACARETERFA